MKKINTRTPVTLLLIAGILIILGLATTASAGWNSGYFNSGNALNPVAVQDEDGHKYLVWEDSSGDSNQIMAQRLDSHGRALWANGGIAVHGTNSLFNQTQPAAISDGRGGLLVCWTDERVSTGVTYLYAMRLDADGNEMWSSGLRGHLVCNAQGNHWLPVIESDGQGGFYVAFLDDRDGGDGVYAQHINIDGDQMWSQPGVRLRGTTNDCSSVALTSLPGGGASFVWLEARGSAFKFVWAQTVDSTGQILWDYDGVMVLSNATTHTLPKIATCNNGALMVSSAAEEGYNVSMEITQLELATGQSAWGRTRLYPTEAGYIIDFEMATSINGGIYMVLAQDTDGPGGDSAVLTMVHHKSDDTQFSKFFLESNYDDLIIGEIASGILAVAWTDPYSEIISCGAYDFRGADSQLWSPAVEVWFIEEFANAAIGFPFGGDNITDQGFMLTWTDQGDLAATFIDPGGHDTHNYPHIVHLNDVPDDQGDWLSMTWLSSSLEQTLPSAISQYSLWMRASNSDPAKAGSPAAGEVVKVTAESGLPENQVVAMLSSGWSYIAVVPAFQQLSYSAIVPSPTNQSEMGSPATDYMVIAHDSEPWTFYRSEVKSGLSVDNLAPGAPSGLAGEFLDSQVSLQWNALSDTAHDLASYQVYGSAVPGFTPSAENFLSQVTTTGFVDGSVSGATYYVVTAKDIHGNEGPSSSEIEVTPGTSSVDGLPNAFHLSSVYPNPFNPNTSFEFTLPSGSWVSVVILDLRGNRVRNLMSDSLSGGTHDIHWNGRDDSGRFVPSGAYFAQVRSSFGSKTVKMTLAK